MIDKDKYPIKKNDNALNNNLEALYTIKDALKEFDNLKNIALNCLDKNGNPNISVAMRAVENKAKISGLFSKDNKQEFNTIVKMSEIKIDGQQLKLNIGEDLL